MKWSVALFACVLACGFALADPPATQPTTQPTSRPAPPEMLEDLQKKLSQVNTVESDFTQEKKLAVLNHTLVIHGHFALQKPGKVIWIVHDPVKYAIRVDGPEVKQWDEDANNVQTFHLDKDPTFQAISQQIEAWFLGDYEKLAQNYDVTLISESPLTLSFAPKGNSMIGKMIKSVELIFGDKRQYIKSMILHENSGSVTTLTYTDPKINQPIADSTWDIPPDEK